MKRNGKLDQALLTSKTSPAFRDALKKVDFNDDAIRSAALASLLDQARQRDTLTLWHLLAAC